MSSNIKLNVKSNKTTLYSLLEDSRLKNNVSNNLPITHTIWGENSGKFHIPDNKLELFFKLYSYEILTNKKVLNIIERHTDVGPMIIDIDLKFDINVKTRQYTEDQVKNVLELYYKEIRDTFIIDEMQDLIAIVFERKGPYESKGTIKDGFHIVFPFIVSEPDAQYLIRTNVVKTCQENNFFSNLDIKNPLSDIFDRSVIHKNGWFMYGSSKPNCDPYLLTHIFDNNLDEMATNELQDRDDLAKNLPKFLSIRRHQKENCTQIRQSKIDDIDKISKGATNFKINKLKSLQCQYYDIKQITQLVNILSDERAEYEPMWIEVGWCLHNIDSGNSDLLALWNEFSKKSSKYRNGECEKLWGRFRKDGKMLGLGSLYYWAQKDSPEKYIEIWRKDIRYYIEKSLTQTNYDVARVLFEMYKYNYKCASIKHNQWFEFRDHRWHEIDTGVNLRSRISTDLVREYCQVMSDYNDEITNVDEDSKKTTEEKEKVKNKIEERLKKLSAITNSLKTTNFKNNIMKECSELFYDRQFLNKLDENRYLLGFDNGVYDLKTGEFRDGQPDDYISISTENDYIEFDENNPYVDDIFEFLSQIQPNYNTREYVITLLSTFLQGYNAEEKFRIWTGCHAKGTEIMMENGTFKKVEKIVIGDKLMGDDSKPRNVLNLVRGKSDMYKISPNKGDSFVVNGDHILCLKATKIGSVYLSDKENRWKVMWQERDRYGYPINKGKNFPYKCDNKKIYKKDVNYYENTEEAHRLALEFYEDIQKSENFIRQNDIIEIPVREYIKRLSKIGERNYYGYRVSVNYDEKEIKLDPYLLGYWIGDGHSATTAITTMENEVVEYYQNKINEMGLSMRKGKSISKASTYHIKGDKNKNTFLEALRKYNLINNKHIPHEYKCNDRAVRLQLLAGIIDSDGHYQEHTKQYEITMKSEKIIDDIVDLCRSLGYACYKKECKKTCTNGKNGPVEGTYYRIQIFGNNLSEIPVLLDRKMAKDRTINKNHLLYGIKIEKVEDNEYYGFTTDSNHRYLLRDFTCTHNCGGNGKSKLMELFTLTVGEYATKFQISLLCGKRPQATAPIPEVANSKGKRLAYLEEPSEGERINVGLMKEYTGGDKIKARTLFKEPVEFKPQFKMLLLCNDLPKVPPHDRGTWRRMEVVEFGSKFVENPKEEGEFPIDSHLSERLGDWKEAFMSILLNYYRQYREYGLKVPYEVLKCTEEYQRDCDTYSELFANILEKSDDKKSLVPIDIIYERYSVWFTDNNCSDKQLSKKDLKGYLVKKYGKRAIAGESIKGYKVKDKPAVLNVIDSDQD